MPIYEYICSKCNNIFSVLKLSSSSEEKTACPSCGSKNVVKKVSSFSCSLPSAGFGGGSFTGGG